MTAGSGVARAGRREWAGLAVLAVPCLLYALDLTVLNLAIPAISESLQPSSVELLWIVDIYGFVLAGSLLTMGTLGDRIGRRRLLLTGAAGFAAASVLAAYSASPGMLIAARALLGVAGATLAPSTLSLIRSMFPDPGQRRIAVGVWISSFSAGGAIGPLVGGLLLEWFWWGSVFLLAVPLMAVLLVLGPLLLPEYRDPEPGRLDLPSAVLSLAAVLAVIYGLKQAAEGGGPGWIAALALVGGAAAGAAFVHRQLHLADPLLDLRLFRRPGFTTALATNLVSFFVGFGILLFTAQYLQLVLGLSPLAAGLWMLPSSAGFIAGSLLTPVIVRQARPALGHGLRAWGSPPWASGCSPSSGRPGPPGWPCWSPDRWCSRSRWPRWTRSPPTWPSPRSRPSEPGRPPRSPRPAPRSAGPWASLCWAWPAPPSTGASWPGPLRPGSRPAQREPRRTPSAAR